MSSRHNYIQYRRAIYICGESRVEFVGFMCVRVCMCVELLNIRVISRFGSKEKT